MSNNDNKSLGEIIKDALVNKGLNQSAIAKKMNVTKQVINQIDRRKYFDLDFLKRLKDATDLDFTNYINHTGRKTTNVNESSESFVTSKVNDPLNTIEMSLTIKIKGTDTQIGNMGELLLALRREAISFGYTIV